MKIYRIAAREIWLDSDDKIVYIKGQPSASNRLNRWEFMEAKDMQSGTVTKNDITFLPPFRKVDEDIEGDVALPMSPKNYEERYDRWTKAQNKFSEKYFTVSVHEGETPIRPEHGWEPGWIRVEDDVPQFALRDIIRQLYDEGYTNESILIEVQK